MSPTHARSALHDLLRLTGVAVATLVICAAVNACSRADRKPVGPPEKITIAYASPPSTTLADIALAKEYFEMEGLEVTPIFLSSGKAALEEVLAGKADAATVAETPLMFAIMNGQKVSIITSIQTTNTNAAIVARKDRGIAAPRDLKGKRIGVTAGTAAEFFLDVFLTDHDISRQEVTVVNLKPDKTTTALVKGDVSAVSTWSPYKSQTQKKLGDKGITFIDEDIYTQFFTIVVAQEYARHNPSGVRKILRALIRAESFVSRDQAETQRIVAELRRIDITSLNDMWKGSTYGVSLDQSLLLALEDESAWAVKSGLTDMRAIPNYLDFISLDGLASVKPIAVRLVK
jgi:sulfonate transport system substrate-binding protein